MTEHFFYKFLVLIDGATPDVWMHYSVGCIAIMLIHVNLMFLCRIWDKGGDGLSNFKGMFGDFNPLFPKNRFQVWCIEVFYFFAIFVLPFSIIAFLKSCPNL